MSFNSHQAFTRKPLHLALCAVLASHAAQAQEEQESAAKGVMLSEIVVTGLRQSLEDAALYKRESIHFTDAVFSEDVGKFPDLNIAEAINRVPGIQLSREVDGSGVNVAIRGLNTNFTKVTLNGAQIAVASSGKTDAINSNRELDLDVFPTEFFRRLDVSKTTTASMIEGGLSGTVNMRSLRPMDSLANYTSYQLQLGYGELSEQISPRASLIGSWKNSDRSLGLLAGVATVGNKVVTEGYESIGWTNANLTFDQCGLNPTAGNYPGTPTNNDCGNSTGGNGFVIGSPIYTTPSGTVIQQPGFHVVPNNTQITGSSGTVYGPGSVIDNDFLLDVNPGMTLDQIGNALIPRLGRPHHSEGDRDRVAGIFSIEWIPNEYGNYFVDVLYAKADRDYQRIDMMLVGRNSQLIPANLQVDGNNIVTSADFHNAQFLLEARPYTEDLDFYSFNPGANFFIGDEIELGFQANATKSTWFRESPSLGLETAMNAGVAAEYLNQGGEYPLVRPNLDLNDPGQIAGWRLERAQIQTEERETETLGVRLDLTVGDDTINWKAGLAYDEADRSITGYDNSFAWRTSVETNIGNTNLGDYLVPGPAGFVTVDFNHLFAASNYRALAKAATVSPNTATGAPTGLIEEQTLGAYLEGNFQTELGTRLLRVNGGLRYVSTDQETAGAERAGDAVKFVYAEGDYSKLLPAFNATFELTDSLLLRGALSRTMTRANPTDMLPSIVFVDTSAQYASQGNPLLKPFTSDNIDLGLEWYFEDEGYASINLFYKKIQGFTTSAVTPVSLAQMGIDFSTLSPQQQNAINQRGGPDQATVGLITPVNSDGELNLQGVEILWVQPLPMVLQGFGYSLNLTNIDQDPKGTGAPAFATEVSKNTFNATTYYENDSLTLRLSYVWYDEQYGSGLGQDGIAAAQRFIDPRGQWDFSASYDLGKSASSPKITFNLINFASDPQREVFSQDNAAYRFYDPGYTAILGFRGVLY